MACINGHSEIVELLIKNSANLNIDLNAKYNDNTRGWMPFQYACQYGYTKIVELLMQNSIEFNIELNSEGTNASTSLHLACKHDHPNIVEILIRVLILFVAFFVISKLCKIYDLDLWANIQYKIFQLDFAHRILL